jgi:hypothetical protein
MHIDEETINLFLKQKRIGESPYRIKVLTKSDFELGNLCQFDHINQMMTLSVITLSGFQFTITITITIYNYT